MRSSLTPVGGTSLLRDPAGAIINNDTEKLSDYKYKVNTQKRLTEMNEYLAALQAEVRSLRAQVASLLENKDKCTR